MACNRKWNVRPKRVLLPSRSWPVIGQYRGQLAEGTNQRPGYVTNSIITLWMLWTPAATLLMPQELSLVARMLFAAAAMLGLATSWRSVPCTDLTALVASVSRSPTVVVAVTEMLILLLSIYKSVCVCLSAGLPQWSWL